MEKNQPPHLWQTSFHRGRMEKEPSTITFEKVFQLITSEHYRDLTEKYRYYLNVSDLKAAKAIKNGSEFITTSALCSGGRTLKHVVAYTSVLMCDFDRLPEGVAAQLIARLSGDAHVLLAHQTLSGGVHVFFPVDVADKDLHAAAYAQGMAHFEKLLGHPADGQCKNLTRTANLCYDPQAYYNPDAVPLHVDVSSAAKKACGRPRKAHQAALSEAVPVVLESLARQGKTYEAGHHNEFISCAVYQLNAFGVSSPEVSDWIRSEYPDFDAAELAGIVRSVYEGHAGEHGSKDLPKAKPEQFSYASVGDLETFIASQCNIRHNIILGRREIAWDTTSQTYSDMTDKDENTLWLRAKKAGLHSPQSTFLSILKSEFIPEFNPLTDYLETCTAWDGTTDYIAQVAAMVHTTADAEFLIALRKWVVGMVASVYDEGAVNQTILTLVGEQGIYKTTFFNRLLPRPLKRYFYTKTNGGRLTKDDKFTLAEMLVICFEEIDNMSVAETNQLKAVITMESTNERAAYARNKEFRPHLASFCATGNNYRFLADESGSRRWRIFHALAIDSPYEHPIPYEGLYAQALALYRGGFQYWYTNEENMKINLQNREFEEPDIEGELILSRFRVPRPGEAGKFMSTAEIMETMGAVIKYDLSKSRVCRAMEKLGFPRMRTTQSRGYRIVQLTPEEIAGRKDVSRILQNVGNESINFNE